MHGPAGPSLEKAHSNASTSCTHRHNFCRGHKLWRKAQATAPALESRRRSALAFCDHQCRRRINKTHACVASPSRPPTAPHHNFLSRQPPPPPRQQRNKNKEEDKQPR